MMTWLTLWPFTLIPFLMVFLLGAIPESKSLGIYTGGYIREWFLNHAVLPLMSNSMAMVVVNGFSRASYLEELALHFLVSLNVFAICFPFMYLAGTGIIHGYTWFSKTSLKQKHTLLNK